MEGEHHGAHVAGNRVGQIEVGLSIKHVTLEGTIGGTEYILFGVYTSQAPRCSKLSPQVAQK